MELDSLAFRFYCGKVVGPRVFAEEKKIFRGCEVSWKIVGASHLVHFSTPFGFFTEAIADPSRLPDGFLFEQRLSDEGTWRHPDSFFSIRWRIREIEKIEYLSFPLVHDFGGGAVTAIAWNQDDFSTRTLHVYPEKNKMVETFSKIELP
ncbi:MAG TPA: hypothetical protein DD435_03055 [Cyanobacteria bacterium UBA8530]|nr:hypothetical protein [Cyanobacteria bacterium UBA8530]